MTVKPPTHTELRKARPQQKNYSLCDGYGLLLNVSRTGCKIWRLRYVHPITSKLQTYTIGGYPQFSVAAARPDREALRKLVARGNDPSDVVKKEKVLEQRRIKAQTVEILAQEWLEMKRPGSRKNMQKSK